MTWPDQNKHQLDLKKHYLCVSTLPFKQTNKSLKKNIFGEVLKLFLLKFPFEEHVVSCGQKIKVLGGIHKLS